MWSSYAALALGLCLPGSNSGGSILRQINNVSCSGTPLSDWFTGFCLNEEPAVLWNLYGVHADITRSYLGGNYCTYSADRVYNTCINLGNVLLILNNRSICVSGYTVIRVNLDVHTLIWLHLEINISIDYLEHSLPTINFLYLLL